MNTNNYPLSIEEKIFDVIFNQQTEGLLLHGKPLMGNEELAEQIEKNLHSYLTEEEIENLVIRNTGGIQDEKIKALILKVLVQIAVAKINQEIRNSLKQMDLEGDNPYSVFTHPKEFLFHKYMKEQIGLKFKGITSPNF